MAHRPVQRIETLMSIDFDIQDDGPQGCFAIESWVARFGSMRGPYQIKGSDGTLEESVSLENAVGHMKDMMKTAFRRTESRQWFQTTIFDYVGRRIAWMGVDLRQ